MSLPRHFCLTSNLASRVLEWAGCRAISFRVIFADWSGWDVVLHFRVIFANWSGWNVMLHFRVI